jgi:hypothetical protein
MQQHKRQSMNEPNEFQLIKIRSVSEAKIFTIKQMPAARFQKRKSLAINEINDINIQENFPRKFVIVHSVLLLLSFLLQISLQVVEININPDFRSGIYSAIFTSIFGLINVVVLFIMSIWFFC